MAVSDDSLRIGRKRLTQVFHFLEAPNHHRNPAKRHLDDQLWHLWFRDLPDQQAIRIASFSDAVRSRNVDDEEAPTASVKPDDDYVLKVRRPKLTPCPPPPDNLSAWLERGWQEPASEPRTKYSQNDVDKQGRTIVVRFEDDVSRLQTFQRWRTQRENWAKNEKPVRDAMRVFEKLYEIRGQIEREGEKAELVLGEGILAWKRPEGDIFHPVLLQRLQLEFDCNGLRSSPA